jgi:epoxyqueuosine reductase
MDYLAVERARQRRADPAQILPEVQSILVLGLRYFDPRYAEAAGAPEPDLYGRVASYAWGDDYHDVLPGRLKALVAFIEDQVGGPVPNRWYTDTGPILERDLAQRAGLGWAGKNTCLIHPQRGSYYLLAEILLGIPLEPDQPITTDHCGSCTRCLQACPTQCILPDRTIDAGRCISYLTIELKGAIPQDLRPHMGDWVFGCDVCQQVCPWNERFAAPQGDLAFAPRPGVPPPELSRELSLTPQEFNRKFKGSPVKRTRRRGYLRNVAVALGNLRDERAVSDLARALLEDLEPLVRGHAAWALGQIGGEPARQTLEEALRLETDLYVLDEIRAALSPAE